MIYRLEEAASTNDIARGNAYLHGDVIVAESQSAGRGQQGNSWHSRPGENLTLSAVLTPSFLRAQAQFLLLEAVSLAVAGTLEHYGLEAHIKWPNDIYLGDNKVAGLLIENDICGDAIARTIAGIGLNINQDVFPASLPNPTSMRLAAGRRFDREEVLRSLCANLASRYRMLEEGHAGEIERDYRARLYRIGMPAQYRTAADGRFIGIIRGVAPTGELAVEHLPGGGTKSYLFKEIEFVAGDE